MKYQNQESCGVKAVESTPNSTNTKMPQNALERPSILHLNTEIHFWKN